MAKEEVEQTTVNEMFDKAISGEISQEDFDQYLDMDAEDSETEDSRTSEADTDTSKAETEDVTDKTDTDDGKAEHQKEEQLEEEQLEVLTKDGKHTMPFSVVENLRTEVKEIKEESVSLKTALDEQKDLVTQLQAAQQKDEETGGTDATDTLLADLEEDYPGVEESIRKIIAPLQEEITGLKNDKVEKDQLTAEDVAKKVFDDAVTEIHDDYHELSKSDKLWDWIDSDDCPALVKAGAASTDPLQVAEVISAYKKAHPAVDSDKSTNADETDAKIAEARAKAQDSSKVGSISEISGGAPKSTEAERVGNMSNSALSDALHNKTPDEIARFLDRHV